MCVSTGPLDPVPWYRVYLGVVDRGNGALPEMTIGQLATRAGVNVETVRYYERRGLVVSPNRTAAGYRQFSDDAVSRILFIKRAQELGFSLNEIQELLELRIDRGEACGEVEEKARDKMALVDEKIERLEKMKGALKRLVDACDHRAPTDDCPILEALEDDPDVG